MRGNYRIYGEGGHKDNRHGPQDQPLDGRGLRERRMPTLQDKGKDWKADHPLLQEEECGV